MDTDNRTERNETVDSDAYGGSRYRLFYDRYQGIVTEKIRGKRSRIGLILIAIVVFVLLGLAISRYVSISFDRIVSHREGESDDATVNFQSYGEDRPETAA